MDEILAGPGMSGFVSILDPPEEVPHLQALVDDIKELRGSASPSRLPRNAAANVIPLQRPEEVGAAGLERDPEPERVPESKRIPGDELAPGPKRVPASKRDTPHRQERDTPPAPPRLAEPPPGSRFHVRRAVLAQDGHSSGEEVLYQSLWNYKYARQESKDTRLVTIGWKAMSKLARMTPRNTRRNCQTLIDKLAIEQLSDENSRESIGRTYRLFSYKSILERRRAAGLEWVTRSRGVAFVAAPVVPPAETAAAPKQESLAGMDPAILLAPDAERVPGSKRDTPLMGSPILRTLREYLPDVDDASVLTLIETCRLKTPDVTDDEINHFVRIKADLMHRMGTVKSPMGFLKASVPRCLEGESFRQFRLAEEQRRHTADQRAAAQEEELRRFQEEQTAILNDPRASEEDRRFARHYLDIQTEEKNPRR